MRFFAILGTAQQELTLRRRFEIGKVLPREIASIGSANIEAGSEKLFGEDIEKLMKNARENFKAASRGRGPRRFHGRGQGYRFHPYNQGASNQRRGEPFLGRGQASQFRRAAHFRGKGATRARDARGTYQR